MREMTALCSIQLIEKWISKYNVKLEVINLFILIRMAKIFEPGFGYGRRIVAHNICIRAVRYLVLWLNINYQI